MKDVAIELFLSSHKPSDFNNVNVYLGDEYHGKRLMVTITSHGLEEEEQLRGIHELDRGVTVYDDVIYGNIVSVNILPVHVKQVNDEEYIIHVNIVDENDDWVEYPVSHVVTLERDFAIKDFIAARKEKALMRLNSWLSPLMFVASGLAKSTIARFYIAGYDFHMFTEEGMYVIAFTDEDGLEYTRIQSTDASQLLTKLQENENAGWILDSGLLFDRFQNPVYFDEGENEESRKHREELSHYFIYNHIDSVYNQVHTKVCHGANNK